MVVVVVVFATLLVFLTKDGFEVKLESNDPKLEPPDENPLSVEPKEEPELNPFDDEKSELPLLNEEDEEENELLAILLAFVLLLLLLLCVVGGVTHELTRASYIVLS